MRISSLLVALCMGVTLSAQVKTPEAPSQRSCAAHDKHVQMMGMDPAYAKHHADIEQQTAAFVQARQEARANGAQMQPVVVTIPVVFHVVYANSTENIPDERLFEQLQILNDDFRRMNADQDNIWPQAADTEIEFCLATRDPNGAPSDGMSSSEADAIGDSSCRSLRHGMKPPRRNGTTGCWPPRDNGSNRRR